MARMGMDVDLVDGIGKQLKQQAHAIETLIRTIEGLINNAVHAWDGNDSRQFHDWWVSQHRPALTNIAHAIDGLGTSAINNANEQRSVSGH